MKLVYKIGEYIKKSLDKIKLIDKCLIIFMMILMGQSIYNLFIHEANLNGGDAIDILIRTTQASVFGYFLSANFIKKDKKINNSLNREEKESVKKINIDNSENAIDSINDNSKSVDSYIVRKEDKYTSNLKENSQYDDDDDESSTTEQQIVIVTIVGIISLIAIIMARDCNIITTASASTISQLRDFVSGSVGFLLGCPTKRNKY